MPYDVETLRRDREEMWAVLFAVGIDFERCVVFEQSAVWTISRFRIPSFVVCCCLYLICVW